MPEPLRKISTKSNLYSKPKIYVNLIVVLNYEGRPRNVFFNGHV